LWNGTYFETFDGGADDKVRVIYMDECRNIYIAGDFETIGGVDTGPVAVLKHGATNFTKIGGDIVFSKDSEVRAISVDCFNIVSTITNKQCTCDVYVVGDIEAQFTNSSKLVETAEYIVKYDASDKIWTSLGGVAAHKINDTPRTVYKKAFNIGLGDAAKIVHVAGTGFYKQYLTASDEWKDIIIDANIQFDTLYYDPEALSTDQLFIGGDFSMPISETETCVNVCEYNRKTGKFSVVGKTNVPGDEIKFLYGNGDDLYAVGNFVNNGLSHAALLTDGETEWKTVSSTDAQILVEEANGIDVCTATTVNCPSGSITIVADNGLAAFYDADKKEWSKFGTTFKPFTHTQAKPVVYTVVSYSTLSSAATTSLSFGCMLIMAVVALINLL
jgi:hypothetical protein